jgi:hypothetical protein
VSAVSGPGNAVGVFGLLHEVELAQLVMCHVVWRDVDVRQLGNNGQLAFLCMHLYISYGCDIWKSVGARPLCALASPSLLGVGPSNSQFPDPALFALLLQGAAARRVVPVMPSEPCGDVAGRAALDVCDVGLSGLSRSSKLSILLLCLLAAWLAYSLKHCQ